MRDSSFSSALLVWILLALAPSAALAHGHRGGHSASHSAGPFSGFGGGFGGFWPAPTLAPVIASPAVPTTPRGPGGRWEFDPNAWRRASPGWSGSSPRVFFVGPSSPGVALPGMAPAEEARESDLEDQLRAREPASDPAGVGADVSPDPPTDERPWQPL